MQVDTMAVAAASRTTVATTRAQATDTWVDGRLFWGNASSLKRGRLSMSSRRNVVGRGGQPGDESRRHDRPAGSRGPPRRRRAQRRLGTASTTMTMPRANKVSTVIVLYGAIENNSWKARSSSF